MGKTVRKAEQRELYLRQVKLALAFAVSILVFSGLFLLLIPGFRAESSVIPQGELGVPIPSLPGSNPPPITEFFGYVSALVSFCTNILGPIIAVLLIVYGGYMYIFSQGDNQIMTKAKDTIFGAIWGYILLFMAKLILNVIGT